jgi:hypothetical protein
MTGHTVGEMETLIGSLGAGGNGPSGEWTARCARVLGLDGVSVSTAAGAGGSELLWYSCPLSARLDDLQFTLGEGPSVEAARDGSLHLIADVRYLPRNRWAGFVPSAVGLGVRSVFALPLRLGAIRIGALTGHRGEAHALTEEGLDAALTLCDALTQSLLSSPPSPARGRQEPPGALHRAVVHQATGMLSVDLGVDLATALDRLRAYAFAQDAPIVTVSRDVVTRRLRLADDRGTGGEEEVT